LFERQDAIFEPVEQFLLALTQFNHLGLRICGLLQHGLCLFSQIDRAPAVTQAVVLGF
jgi:hypothetical protein